MDMQHVVSDSYIIHDFLGPGPHAATLEAETEWGDLYINGHVLKRQGCFVGERVGMGTPWLRCPSISGATVGVWKGLVDNAAAMINRDFGVGVNIAKVQRYDDGNIGIASHSDKIIDLAEIVPIFNLRLGATRAFVLQNKQTGEKIRVDMPDNTLFVLGYQTNKEWRHAIERERGAGVSYSIIFRQTVTFRDGDYIFGERTPLATYHDLVKAIQTETIPSHWEYDIMHGKMVEMYARENRSVVTLEDYRPIIENSVFVYP